MRLKSGIWVQAYIRRCSIEGAYAVVRRRGADEAGAVFVKIDRLDGTADLFGPAPQAVFVSPAPSARAFARCLTPRPAADADVEARLKREIEFDPDVWILEVEDRSGRHFLEQVVD
jgi:hypothetical protein